MNTLLKLTLLAIALFLLLAGGLGYEAMRRFDAPGPHSQPVTVIIPKGLGLDAIARRLAEAGVLDERLVFSVAARLSKANPRAGEYAFAPGQSPRAILAQMVEGRTVIHKLTIAEGLTVRQALDLVRQAEFLSGDVTRLPPEGSLLPDTWHLSRDDSRDELVARMERRMRETLDSLWAGRSEGLAVSTPHQALVLASIVERETGVPQERPLVAGVFNNRLKIGMRLQSDPTVIYGLSEGLGVLERPLTRADLAAGHSWNTYVIAGLPPSPIANPGRASLEAVLHPAATDALYFVADGTGGHAFSRSLDQHNAKVGEWRRIEKERKAGR